MAADPPGISEEDFPQGATKERPKRRLKAVEPDGSIPADLPQPLSEQALAAAWVEQNGENWRYVEAWGRWYEWGGAVWRRVEGNKHFELAANITRQALHWPDAQKISDDQRRKLCSARIAASLLSFVKADPKIEAYTEQWDADPWKLATPEGVIDLKTGLMVEAAREQYCTKSTSVPMAAADAGEPTLWLQCLARWFGDDDTLIRYAQLFAGYAATGATSEKMFLFVYGGADTGKSTFVEVMQAVLGDYAQSASMDTFTESKQERHTTELAELVGARFVTAPETQEGRKWNQARINQLTGKDRVRARYMRQDNFEYIPQFKLLVYGNYAPHVNNVDGAMRRRIHILPFGYPIPREEQDDELDMKLRAEYPQILAWIIEGCLEWQRIGLTMPEVMQGAIDKYLEAEDSFGDWIAECVERTAEAFTSRKLCYKSFRDWCEANGEHAVGSKRFSQKLELHGFERGKRGGERGFKNMMLKPAAQYS